MKKDVERMPAGIVTMPPSKSLAHRALICAALASRLGSAQGVLSLETLAVATGLSSGGASEDIRATAEGICGLVNHWEQGGEIDCGESGSTLRFLIPIAAMTGGAWTFRGRGRLLARPMEIYRELFSKYGVLFEQTEEDGGAIRVQGRLPAGEYRLRGDVSSQFVSGLLLALPLAAPSAVNESRIIVEMAFESSDYVRLTLDTMRAFGIHIGEARQSGRGEAALPLYTVAAGQRYALPSGGYRLEGDWSQAAFFLCAGALGADVSVAGLNMNSSQGDRRALEVLERMGAEISWELDAVRARPPADGILRGLTIDAREIPDIVPPLAALACYAAGETRFTGAARLRIKESDRLAALAVELAKAGADIAERPDGLMICGRPPAGGLKSDIARTGIPTRAAAMEVSAHGDHRIAMALAVYAIRADRYITIDGAESVAKSYPAFWDDFERGDRL